MSANHGNAAYLSNQAAVAAAVLKQQQQHQQQILEQQKQQQYMQRQQLMAEQVRFTRLDIPHLTSLPECYQNLIEEKKQNTSFIVFKKCCDRLFPDVAEK